jgi:hypothetical protein
VGDINYYMISTRKMKNTSKGIESRGDISSSSNDVELQQSVTADGWKFYLDEKLNGQNTKLEKLNILDKLDKGIRVQNEKLNKLNMLDSMDNNINPMTMDMRSFITYLKDKNSGLGNTSNNVGNVQGSTVPIVGIVTRNIEVGQSSAEKQIQAYNNNERPTCYPEVGLNLFRDDLRVEIPVGEPYFEQPRVEFNRENFTRDVFRTEPNKNAHQKNDGAYKTSKSSKE